MAAVVRFWNALAALAFAMITGCGRVGFDALDLQISPSTTRSNLNTITQFVATGGEPPYTFVLESGTGELDQAGTFRAATYPGAATVAVTDASGDVARASITFGGDYLYYMGGFETVPRADVYRSFDGITWDLIGALPGGRSWGATWVFDDAMYYAGGDTDGSGNIFYDQVFRSVDGVTWNQIGTLPIPMEIPGAAVFKGRLWVFCGAQFGNGYRRDILSSADGVTWRTEGQFPIGIHGAEVIVYKDRLWSLAGHISSGQTNVSFVSDDGVNWTALPAFPAPGEYLAPTVSGDRMWAAGGLGLADRVVWSTDGMTWTDADRLSASRVDARLVEMRGELWIIGGQPATTLHSVSGVGWASAGSFPVSVIGGRMLQFTPAR